MRFEDSKYYSIIPSTKLEFPFGDFYLTETFVISEIGESVHFTWDDALKAIEIAVTHYPDNHKVVYISNRVNSYSVDPEVWKIISNDFDFIIASAIVYYNNFSFMSASLEKHFYKESLILHFQKFPALLS